MFDHLLNQECVYFADAPTLNNDGDKTFSNGSTTPCRFARINRVVKREKDKEVVQSAQFQFNFAAKIGARVDYGGVSYQIDEISDWVDGDGEIIGCLARCINYPVN